LRGLRLFRLEETSFPLEEPFFRPLDHFTVNVDASGNLTVNTDEIVSESQRLAG
jgi:hypothetical protein